jgi:hypothetical protein
MADRTIVEPQTLARTGIVPIWHAATATVFDSFANNGKVIVHIINGGAELTLTIPTPGTVDDEVVADRTVTIPAIADVVPGEMVLDFLPTAIYNQSNGRVYLNWSRVSNVTFALLKAS